MEIKIKRALGVILIILPLLFSFSLARAVSDTTETIKNISYGTEEFLQNTSSGTQDWVQNQSTEHSQDIGNFQGTFTNFTIGAREKIIELSQDPFVLSLIPLIIIIAILIFVKNTTSRALELGQNIAMLVFALSFIILGGIIIFQETGYIQGMEEISGSVINTTALVLIISLGSYLLLKIIPK